MKKEVKKKMENELKPWKVGVALGIVFVIISFICALLFAFAPETTLNLADNIFHGIDLNPITKSLSWTGVVIGLIEVFIIGFVGGWLFGLIYNTVNKY